MGKRCSHSDGETGTDRLQQHEVLYMSCKVPKFVMVIDIKALHDLDEVGNSIIVILIVGH